MGRQYPDERLAKQLNQTTFPIMEDPFMLKIRWMKVGAPSISAEESGKISHHHRFYEVHFCLEGAMQYEMEEKDIFSVEENCFLLIPPGITHKKTEKTTNSVRFTLAYELPQQTEEREKLAKSLRCTEPFVGLITSEMSKLLEGMLSGPELCSPLGQYLLRNDIFHLICRISAQKRLPKVDSTEADTVRKSMDSRVRYAMCFIEDNLDMPLRGKDVSDSVHISYKQLNRLFVAQTGGTVLQYIHGKKSERARELLLNSSDTLCEISTKLGFENEYYFNAFFKRMNGISPGNFRRKHKIKSKNVEK